MGSIAQEGSEKNQQFTPWLASPISQCLMFAIGFAQLAVIIQIWSRYRLGLFRSMSRSLLDSLGKLFDESVVTDATTKKALKDKIATHIDAFAGIEIWRLIAWQAITILQYATILVAIVAFQRWLRQLPIADLRRFLLENAYAFLITLIIPGLFLRFVAQHQYFRYAPKNYASAVARMTVILRISRWWPVVWGVFLAVTWSRRVNAVLPMQFKWTKYSPVVFALGVCFGIRLISFLNLLINYVINRERHQFADSVVAVYLLSLLELLQSRAQITDAVRRRLVITLLENISNLFEYSLVKQIVGPATNSESLERHLGKIGNGVRSLKMRVAVPRSSEWDTELLTTISDFLVNFLSLNWKALPTAERREVSRPKAISRTKDIVRWLVAAVIPVILLAILQRSPLRLTPERAELAFLIALAWFALSILLRLDPEFSAKAKTLKEVQDIATFGLKP